LHYEFQQHADESYNGMMGTLVRLVRRYYNTPQEEAQDQIPPIQAIAAKLRVFDEQINEPERDYIQEILDALSAEGSLEENLMGAITSSCTAITKYLFEKQFTIKEYAFEFNNSEAVQWLEFYGYKEKQTENAELQAVKEIFRSVCSHHKVIFIDSSLARE
jgi:hypothetical protein